MRRGKIYKRRRRRHPVSLFRFTNSKRRPALVLAESSLNDLILFQITSQDIKDSFAIPLSDNDFSHGRLNKTSNVRPNKLFTADSSIILYKIGSLSPEKLDVIIDRIVVIFKGHTHSTS